MVLSMFLIFNRKLSHSEIGGLIPLENPYAVGGILAFPLGIMLSLSIITLTRMYCNPSMIVLIILTIVLFIVLLNH